MRIAILAGAEFPSLSKTFILDHIVSLIQRGHHVDIFAEYPGDSSVTHPDIETYSIKSRTKYQREIPKNHFSRLVDGCSCLLNFLSQQPSATLNVINPIRFGRDAVNLRTLYQVAPYILEKPYDVVHCHFGSTALKALELRDLGLLQGKLITTFHGIDISRDLKVKGEHIYDRLFREGDLFLPISELWQKKLIHLGCDPNKIKVHRMGIDCDSFRFIPRAPSSNGTMRLISICRLVEKKGIEFAIKAVAEAGHNVPNLVYDIIGDGPQRSRLQDLIDDLGISSKVHLHGWQEKTTVIKQLEQAHIFLAPSITAQNGDQEGIPVAIMEAMAMGLPIISTLHSGIPELVANNLSGLLVPERDVKELATAISTLRQNPECWIEMGDSGRKHVAMHYNIQTLSNHLVEQYKELITQ